MVENQDNDNKKKESKIIKKGTLIPPKDPINPIPPDEREENKEDNE